MDDTYENESRLPGGVWSPAGIPWTDVVRITSYRRRRPCLCALPNGENACDSMRCVILPQTPPMVRRPSLSREITVAR